MKKVLGILGCAALLLVGASIAVAATAKQMPDSVKLNACQAKQPAVTFPHKTHVAVGECKTCHHTQADLKAGSDTAVQKCGPCHVKPEKETTPKCAEMSMTKNPFHIKCVGCHKATVAKDATKKAPTKCAECHKK